VVALVPLLVKRKWEHEKQEVAAARRGRATDEQDP